jgi:hypothetical protein
MENFQRDLERNRVKKEPGDNIKKKWSVLFISSTGKVFNLTYIRAAAFVGLFFILSLAAALLIALSAVTFVKKDNLSLIKKLEQSESRLAELKNENEQLRIKLAFLKPADSVVKAETIPEKKDSDTKENGDEKNDRPKKIEDFSKIPLEARNFRIESLKDQVRANFDIVNISKSDLTISGYVFVLLKNDDISENHWMISPYSKITGGKPLSPKNGQYFSIQRFKPVTIKFPGISGAGVLDRAAVFVYAEDGELVMKKGFSLNEN